MVSRQLAAVERNRMQNHGRQPVGRCKGFFAPLGQSDFIYDTFDAAIDEQELPERKPRSDSAPRAQHPTRMSRSGRHRRQAADAAPSSSAQLHRRRMFSTGDPFLDAAMRPPAGEGDTRSSSRGIDGGRRLDTGVTPTARASHTHRFRFQPAHPTAQRYSTGSCATNHGRRGATEQKRDYGQRPAQPHKQHRSSERPASHRQECATSLWKAFEARKGNIRFAHIPWPSGTEICVMNHRGAQRHAKRRGTHAPQFRALRMAQRRWHPDKFVQKFGKRLDQRERARIIAKCADVTAHLNTMQEALFE